MIVGDVARWGDKNKWKEPPQDKDLYFPPLKKKEKKVA